MFRLNDKEFSSATEALDYYIANYDFDSNTNTNNILNRKLNIYQETNQFKMVNKNKSSSLNNLPTELTKESNACHEIEKLLNVLTNRIQDYKKDEISLQNKPTKLEAVKIEDDPILKSLSRFEDLNKQLSSNNLFERIDSSLQFEQAHLVNIVPFKNNDKQIAKDFKSSSCENFMQECMKIIN